MRAMGVGLRKPKDTLLGVDFAGTVEAVAKTLPSSNPAMKSSAGAAGFAQYVVRVNPGSCVEAGECEF